MGLREGNPRRHQLLMSLLVAQTLRLRNGKALSPVCGAQWVRGKGRKLAARERSQTTFVFFTGESEDSSNGSHMDLTLVTSES